MDCNPELPLSPADGYTCGEAGSASEVVMLEPFIIRKIKEEEERRRRDKRTQIPLYYEPPRPDERRKKSDADDEDDQDGSVIEIEL